VDTQATAPALSARGVSKRYGEREALRGVDVAAQPGELLAVIGPNGAGKTTLLSIMAGVLEPTAGAVEAAGRVGWVPQESAVYGRLSVAENLRLFARLEHLEDPDAAVEEMLAQTGLQERANDELGSLSGGNRQRVNLAIGLLGNPAALLLDEPSGALDPRQRARLWQFIESHAAAGTSVVFATHDIAEAGRHSHRMIVLADGELLFDGTPDELASVAPDADLERAFVDFLASKGH
jgi:ABC-2 type transport system ATP-binding protein